MSLAVEKKQRSVARVPAAIRKTIQEAADLVGTSFNQFVVNAAHRQAEEVLERESVVRLTREDAERVFSLVANPPEPNAFSREIMAAHRRGVREQS